MIPLYITCPVCEHRQLIINVNDGGAHVFCINCLTYWGNHSKTVYEHMKKLTEAVLNSPDSTMIGGMTND